MPLAVPLWMMRSDATRTRDGGMAAAQAVLVSFAATNLLKAVTGRLPPDAETPHDVDRRSRRFRFGFLPGGGVFHGWPSGHAMTNMALAASLEQPLRRLQAGQVLRLRVGRLCHGSGDHR